MVQLGGHLQWFPSQFGSKAEEILPRWHRASRTWTEGKEGISDKKSSTEVGGSRGVGGEMSRCEVSRWQEANCSNPWAAPTGELQASRSQPAATVHDSRAKIPQSNGGTLPNISFYFYKV